MIKRTQSIISCVVIAGALTVAAPAVAQTAGTAGASGPIISEGQYLPAPSASFTGHIGREAKDSTPDFPKAVEAPKRAPNILLIMTDDVGYSASSTFGGPVPTPTMPSVTWAIAAFATACFISSWVIPG